MVSWTCENRFFSSKR